MLQEPLLRKVCCLSGIQVPTLIWLSDNYPLLVSQVGSDEVTRKSKGNQEKFQGLGMTA